MSPKDFMDKFPPPWNIINKILEASNLLIRVSEIDLANFWPEIEIEFYYYNTITHAHIDVDGFSSGEKIIIGLIARLFITNQYESSLAFPDLILLDEPDANLHPHMTSLLLNVLYETFVKKLNIQVIITTHSIATVALAPEHSIYQIKNIPETEILKITKDEALALLTENIPTLSIDYKHHKQIFVESPTDQKYFQNLFNKLKTEVKVSSNLYFITGGYGKSNCDSVIKITNEIRASGSKTAFGIIDWDAKRFPTDGILVHGYNKRYSIENFLFDPIYLVVLFINQNLANNIGELGYSNISNPFNIGLESEAHLQNAVNWIISKLQAKYNDFSKLDYETVKYANGVSLKIPQQYLMHQGHTLEIKLKETFKSLQKFQDANSFSSEMCDIVAKCYPFVPLESCELIKTLILPSN